jgi:lysophospholipase L1-like esterase
MKRLPNSLKHWLFAMLPAVLLLVGAEVTLRVVLHFVPAWDVVVAGVAEVVEDRDLFWRLKPNLDTHFKLPPDGREGPQIRTNSLGLRDEPIAPKAENEFRILCLGESTTYGAFVAFEETYGRVAQRVLNARAGRRRYRVINAAVPAYTSFQSLVYLKKYGLKLRPDVVVLYHEGNDYLPCGWGDASGKDETDPECYARRQTWWWTWPLGRLRLVRVPSYWISRRGLDAETFRRAWGGFGNRVRGIKTRLTIEQQQQVLEEFEQVCTQAGVRLVAIHPTYRNTVRHRCPLQDFCRQRGVPLMETFYLYDHRNGRPIPDAFIDEAHPTAASHRLIGEALARFLREQPWFGE